MWHEKTDKQTHYTDDAALVEAAGVPVHIFKGDYDNIKITHRQDITRIARILQCKK